MDIRSKAFAPRINQIQKLPGRRQSAFALPRCGNRMSRLSVKFYKIALQAQRVHIGPALAPRPAVHHHGQRHVVKDALGSHAYLSAVFFLCRGPNHMHFSPVKLL